MQCVAVGGNLNEKLREGSGSVSGLKGITKFLLALLYFELDGRDLREDFLVGQSRPPTQCGTTIWRNELVIFLL